MISYRTNKTASNWLQIRVPVNSKIEEAIINFLFELGSCGCQQFENTVVAYFTDTGLKEKILEKMIGYLSELSSMGCTIPEAGIEFNTITDQDWNAVWKAQNKPIKISNKLIIKPTWSSIDKPVECTVIEIDPKQAFGTGEHATTQMALQLLMKYLQENQVVLDVGTGTGILAITAAKFKASNVFALDTDPLAAITAKENIQLNIADKNIHIFIGKTASLKSAIPHFDLILANLNKTEILKLRQDFYSLLRCSGYLMVTGLLKDEYEEVSAHFSKPPRWKLIDKMTKSDWLALVFMKENL